MINKRKQIIEVVEYRKEWITQFHEEATLIKNIFKNNFSAIHHIGSTAIPNMPAKPTIDILLEVKKIDLVDNINDEMAILGYEAWGEYNIPGRRFFVKGENKRTHHVHCFQSGCPDIERHLCFRDFLIEHPIKAKEYAKLKIKLANKFAYNRHAYVIAKSDYVKSLENEAIKWANG